MVRLFTQVSRRTQGVYHWNSDYIFMNINEIIM